MKRYEFIEHTADIVIKAYGDNLEDAFAAAAEAMFDIITDNSKIEPKEKVELEVVSDNIESLLVSFLSRLIVVHEVDNLVLGNFDIKFSGKYHLKAYGWGEKFDSKKHKYGHHVKGISYHMIKIFDSKDQKPSYVQVLFDV